MRVLYGVCGEGFGHSSRANKIIGHLLKRGHKILVVTYGQAYDVLRKYKTVKVSGLKMVFEKGRLKVGKTVAQNVQEFFADYKLFGELKREIDKFKPEICISDMEMLVPIVSHYYNLPLVSLDNQHRITHFKLKVPKKYFKDYLLAKSVVHRIVARADAFIVLSFVKQKSSKKVYFVDPLLREEVVKLRAKKGDEVLVYQTKPDKDFLEILKKIPEKFVVYGYQKNKRDGNFVFKKFGKKFLRDLANCKAVIATSGFSLISEAIYLKKPYFAIPLKGQFEQVLNALFLKKAGFGNFAENPTEKDISVFLHALGKYEGKLKGAKIDPYEALKILDNVLRNLKKRKA